MEILLLGLSHRTAPVEIREHLDFDWNSLRSALTHFDMTHSQAHLPGVNEGVILSTCNRTEIYTVVNNVDVARQGIIDLLSQSCGADAVKFSQYLFAESDEDAVHHLFEVAAGLDSMVLGEPQILGQVTDAYEVALSQRAAGTVLSRLFTTAIHTGKRARTETSIGVNHASVSSVAASLAGELLGNLADRHVLLIGAGEMGAIAVRSLVKRGAQKITVANRTFEKASELAAEWGGKAITFQQMPEAMVRADIIITSTGAPHTILNKKLLAPFVAQRIDRPLFIIDIAVPRDVAPDVAELPNVVLHDIDDLQGQADDNIEARKSEVPGVRKIVREQVDLFMQWYASLDVVSTITDLRQQIETVRQKELKLLFNRLDLDEREEELVKTMSHRLVNKILHHPTIRLKGEATEGNAAVYVSILRDLFSLGADPTGEYLNGNNRPGGR
jgi:glutamyl-tRNA reductase